MDEITKIVFEANKERRTLNLDDIKNICYHFVRRNGYKPLSNIEIADRCRIVEAGKVYIDNKQLGFYKREDNSVFYFYDTICDFSLDKANEFNSEYSPEETTIDVLNYYFLTLIFHELVHVRQDYLAKSNYNGFEKKLFSIFNTFGNGDEIYDNNKYDIITEVNARNLSYILAFNVYSKLPKNFVTKYDKMVYQLSILKLLLYSNYDINLKNDEVYSPAERIGDALTDQMLSSFNMTINDYAKLIYSMDKLTLYNKLMCGLPISLNEYAYTNLLISELGSGLDVDAIKKIQKRI